MDEHTPHREFVSRLEFRVNMDDKTVQMRINSLRNALRIIFANEMHTLSFCDVYNIVYTLTIGQHGLLVHNVVQDVVSEHARNVDSVDSLGSFWTSVHATRDVCMYLYRTHEKLKSQSVEGIAKAQLSNRKPRALEHLRRIAPRVGKLRFLLLQLHAHVHYKPNGRGEASAKAEFESVAHACIWNDSNRRCVHQTQL